MSKAVWTDQFHGDQTLIPGGLVPKLLTLRHTENLALSFVWQGFIG